MRDKQDTVLFHPLLPQSVLFTSTRKYSSNTSSQVDNLHLQVSRVKIVTNPEGWKRRQHGSLPTSEGPASRSMCGSTGLACDHSGLSTFQRTDSEAVGHPHNTGGRGATPEEGMSATLRLIWPPAHHMPGRLGY